MQVMRGHERWDDPIARACDDAQRTSADVEDGSGPAAVQHEHVAVEARVRG